MLDDNWDLIRGPVATEIEVINATSQINVLDGLVKFLLAHNGPDGTGKPPMPDEAALCNLHHAGTVFLLDEPGRYRNIRVDVRDKDNNIIHEPPEWQDVPRLMRFFFRQLSSVWNAGDHLDNAAYALWMINWVHPFRNGNGRTARAFCYAVLCLKIGVELPGAVTVIDLIMHNRPQYYAALRAADTTFKENGIPDLQPMKQFIGQLLQMQIASAQQQAGQAMEHPDTPAS
ncbi:Fic family protein [Ferrovibrio sp.]|uniref:Fic family protein n=1 Tax=Ferrovibrio sp. TaxID=1917215 RepID=UPI002602080C|nr:Fic family protein [Ferrovibrio sp.]